MLYRNVRINRDHFTQPVKQVAAHEIPVLEAIFDKGNVKILPGWHISDRAYQTMQDEYTRLTMAYGREAVEAAYPTVAKLTEKIAWWMKALSTVRGVKMPKFGRQERADIPTPTVDDDHAMFMARTHRGVEYHEGLMKAVNEALDQCTFHDRERERFSGRE